MPAPRVMTAPRAFVIGHPIAHSRSPLLHGHWLATLGIAGSYERIDVAPEALDGFLSGMKHAGFAGGNITVPHKQAALAHIRHVDAAARAIGAVNTVWLENGALAGGNTDAEGFAANLADHAPDWRGRTEIALVLGAGGAARAVVYAWTQRGIKVLAVNRTLAHAQKLAADFGPLVVAHGWEALPLLLARADLLVNTTTLGMAGKPPLEIDLSKLKRSALVCDIVYVPLQTRLLADALALGHGTIDGLGMLLHQAVPGFARWFGVRPTVTPGLRALLEADIAAGFAKA